MTSCTLKLKLVTSVHPKIQLRECKGGHRLKKTFEFLYWTKYLCPEYIKNPYKAISER